MRYTDLLRACGGDAHLAYSKARGAALLPLFGDDGSDGKLVRRNIAARSALYAALLKVPRRVLKRWTTRALKSLPRGQRLTGPRLAMSKLGTLFPRGRRVTRRRTKRLVSKVKRGGSTT